MPLPILRLFVYGTLKTGCRNHAQMTGFASVEDSCAQGRLFLRPPRWTPYLQVPANDIYAYGTADPLHDVEVQQRMNQNLTPNLDTEGQFIPEGWHWVEGQLFTFTDPVAHLPRLDAFEEFFPNASSLYERVLIPVGRDRGRLAWTYIMPTGHSKEGLIVSPSVNVWTGNELTEQPFRLTT